MDRRPYTKPSIVRVELSHEQAVLAACSTTTSSLSNITGLNCKVSACRRNTAPGSRDNAASS